MHYTAVEKKPDERWERKPSCNLDWKNFSGVFFGTIVCNILTVSGSFSNTSLASSLVHLSSTHSLSKCPCLVSSKTWFALLCLLRNWFASWGDNETTKEKKEKDTHTNTWIHLQKKNKKKRSNKSGVKQYFGSKKKNIVAKHAALKPR